MISNIGRAGGCCVYSSQLPRFPNLVGECDEALRTGTPQPRYLFALSSHVQIAATMIAMIEKLCVAVASNIPWLRSTLGQLSERQRHVFIYFPSFLCMILISTSFAYITKRFTRSYEQHVGSLKTWSEGAEKRLDQLKSERHRLGFDVSLPQPPTLCAGLQHSYTYRRSSCASAFRSVSPAARR